MILRLRGHLLFYIMDFDRTLPALIISALGLDYYAATLFLRFPWAVPEVPSMPRLDRSGSFPPQKSSRSAHDDVDTLI